MSKLFTDRHLNQNFDQPVLDRIRSVVAIVDATRMSKTLSVKEEPIQELRLLLFLPVPDNYLLEYLFLSPTSSGVCRCVYVCVSVYSSSLPRSDFVNSQAGPRDPQLQPPDLFLLARGHQFLPLYW